MWQNFADWVITLLGGWTDKQMRAAEADSTYFHERMLKAEMELNILKKAGLYMKL